jgi:hypothetical protein
MWNTGNWHIFPDNSSAHKHHSIPDSLETKLRLNSVAWVHERTISTEWPTLFGEVSANFCGYKVTRGQRGGSLRPYSWFSIPEPLLFFQVAHQMYSWGWVDPVPDKLFLRKYGSAGNRTRASGSVARNSDHWTTEAVFEIHYEKIVPCLSFHNTTYPVQISSYSPK